METNTSNKVPYIVVGSAIGGVAAYLFMTESGRRVRREITSGEKLEDARMFIEKKGRAVTDEVRGVLDKAKESMAAGQHAYEEAEQSYRSQLKKIESKNNEIASGVHKTIDNWNRTAYTMEQTVLDPIYEVGAIARGIDRGVRTFLGFFRRGRKIVPSRFGREERMGSIGSMGY